MATHFEVRIFTNRMIVRNVATGQSIARAATRPFSSSRLLIGDLDAAEQVLGEIIKEMAGWRRFLQPAGSISFIAMEQCAGGLCPVEAQLLCDLAVRVGVNKADISSVA